MFDDLGAGECGAGSSFFGYGEPYTQNSTAGKVFLDANGRQRNAALINPNTGDIVRDMTTGIHMGMDSVAQMVYLALRTIKGSSVISSFGIEFKFKTISNTTVQKVKEAVQAALQDLVLRQLIEITEITVNRAKVTGIEYTVKWKNLTNGETNTQNFQVK